MNHSRPARTRVARLVVLLVLLVALGQGALALSSSTAASPLDVFRTDHGRGVGADDGVVRGHVTVFDRDAPAVTRLDPDLVGALRRAATDAAEEGVELQVNSGWRSKRYQDQLLSEAISEYGSRERAARWVATPTTSPHVFGEAVDLGPLAATMWLSQHGAAYGLCQIYANERWHYELRPDAVGRGCPPAYADPTHDPRMQP
jgi:D-alanyl-D-alanine carboxypeptidase